jgi:hypothetical protein
MTPTPPVTDPELISLLNEWRILEQKRISHECIISSHQSSLKYLLMEKTELDRKLRKYIQTHLTGKSEGTCGLCSQELFENIDHDCPNR